jgi:hypothetical protein
MNSVKHNKKFVVQRVLSRKINFDCQNLLLRKCKQACWTGKECKSSGLLKWTPQFMENKRIKSNNQVESICMRVVRKNNNNNK